MPPVRVFVCDDSASLRLLVREMLRDGGEAEVVGEAATVADAEAALPGASADVVLVDLLEESREDDLIPRLRAAAPRARFVVYSGRPEREGSEAEAHVSKAAPFEELRRVVAEVAAASA